MASRTINNASAKMANDSAERAQADRSVVPDIMQIKQNATARRRWCVLAPPDAAPQVLDLGDVV